MSTRSTKPVIFISYSHKDEPDRFLQPGETQWLTYVRSFVAPAEAHGRVELWDDRCIDGGGDWRADINDALERCTVCVFLVSRHSLSSRFILDVEMQRMLEQHYTRGAHLYPIVITSTDLGVAPWLHKLNLKPTNGTALELYETGPRNKVMSDLASEIRTIVERTALKSVSSLPADDRTRRVSDAAPLGQRLPPPPVVMAPPEVAPTPASASVLRVQWEGDFSAVGSTVSGREADLKGLTDNAIDPGVAVVAVTALGGQGKTALVRAWIEGDVRAGHVRTFDGVFAFSFYHGRTQEEFARKLAEFLDPTPPPSAPDALSPIRLVELLRGRRILLFLDGLEEIQNEEQERAEGRVAQGPVLDLLFGLCVGEASESLAVITSRLRLVGFEEFDEARVVVGIELGGLKPEAGGKLLFDLGVRNATQSKREEYSHDLEGHPLLLHVFADAVRRRALTLDFGNSAEKVAEAMGLAAPIAFKDKLNRVVDSYRGQFSTQERAIIEAVAVFGGTATIQRIRAYLRQRNGAPSAAGEAAVARQIEALLTAGILQFRDDEGAHRYSCHPILRERFQPDAAGTRSAATISLYSRPAPLRPRTLAEAEPYLEAIRIHTNAGAFKEASKILGRHLDYGDILDGFVGGQRALLGCLLGFLRPDRRNACEAKLKRSWLNAMVPRVVLASIALYEWEIADEYARWDAELTANDTTVTKALNFRLRAEIAAEVGAADDARALYESAIVTAEKDARGPLILERAELERNLGAPHDALRLIREWMAMDQPVARWIAGWDRALETLGRILSRSRPDLALRCKTAQGAIREALRTNDQSEDAYREYELLNLKRRAERTQDDWQRLLELADLMERHHKAHGTKALGNWPIGRAIALNGLGRAPEAMKLAWSAFHQSHKHSWRRLWLRIEIARARLLQGHIRGGLEDAWTIIESARRQQRYLVARDTAELIVEYGEQNADRTREAQCMLDEFNERLRPADKDIPDLGPLPGEPGWDGRVTHLLLREVRPERRDTPATQEEFDAALVLAAELGISNAIAELLRLGASPRAAAKERGSGLQVAIERGHQQVVEMLLGARSESFDLEDERDRDAAVAAIAASQSGVLKHLLDACATKKPDLLAALVVNAAAIGSSGETIRVLCNAGADPRQLQSGQHPLVRAARAGNLSAVEAIADRMGDINKATDAGGETALMAAMGAGHEPIIIWLVDRGAKIDERDDSGRTAPDYAAQQGRVQALELLAAVTGRDVLADIELATLAVAASFNGQVDELRRAIERGARIDEEDQQGHTPLVVAAAQGHLDVIRAMRELAPSVDIDAPDRDSQTALMAAAEVGHEAVATALMKEFGARLDAADRKDRDAITHALAGNQPDMIRLLTSHDARPRDSDATIAAIRIAAASNNRNALVAFLRAVAKAGWMDRLSERVAL